MIMKKKILRKKSHKLLLIDYDQLSREEMVATVGEIANRLHTHFRNHIGFENATYPVEIFENVIGVDPDSLSIYKKEYWWNIIKKIMSRLRYSEDLFVIHRGQKWFVLKSENEANDYRTMMTRTARALINSTKKADKWVRNKSWTEI